jgi:putative methyltransferase
MSFPKAVRISYSTCSVHEEENEGVVARVLAERSSDFEVVEVIPQWPRRGIKPQTYPFASRVIRAERTLDGTTGFFVAAFQRRSGADVDHRPKSAPTTAPSAKRRKNKNKGKQTEPEAAATAASAT